MDTPIVTSPSGVFNFLGLPSELRNRIYQLHLSKKGEVDGLMNDDELRIYDPAMVKPIIGVNILRVCRQTYNEAVTYAYTNCTWSLGAPLICTDCLIRFPRGTVEKIQHVRLHIRVYICSSTTSPVMRITMSDLIKMKSLRSLELTPMSHTVIRPFSSA
jgi:hypothetical protein